MATQSDGVYSLSTIALLPLKGHSARIPNKNIRLLGGKPLFFHIADVLLGTNIFDLLCIDTDSEKIIDLAEERYPKNWLIIHERPNLLWGDDVSMNRIIAHDVCLLGSNNRFMQTHSTNPFLSPVTIATAYDQFIEGLDTLHDSFFSITCHQSRFFDESFKPLNHDPNELIKTQDLSPIYEENSCFYFFTSESFKKTQSRIGERPRHFVAKAGSVEFLDIDTAEQWALAEAVVKSNLVSDEPI